MRRSLYWASPIVLGLTAKPTEARGAGETPASIRARRTLDERIQSHRRFAALNPICDWNAWARAHSAPLTPEDVRRRVGLLPWDEQIARMRAVHEQRRQKTGEAIDFRRRTGRTWAMLCEVVAYLATGGVAFIIGHTKSEAESMRRQALDWAAACGLGAVDIRALTPNDRDAVRGLRHYQLFTDHFVYEAESAREMTR